ncbi:hypothetical protein QFC19_008553 [Naganishia cerealis]|uniref:Uncharacterized protein n=1 Tax=Naganishia cerealis TaxID=610337 RepID=A0ACC2V1Z7_9TREE|nr:hypothetical protein QFC19_008553 [Naganishia cerealis]
MAEQSSRRAVDPQERKYLIEGLSNPLLFHRHSQALSDLQKVIGFLERTRKFVSRAESIERSEVYATVALLESVEQAGSQFLYPLICMNREKVAGAGGTDGMWEEEERRRRAVSKKLVELERAKQQCVNSSELDSPPRYMCLINGTEQSPIQESLINEAYIKSLAELTDFASLLVTIDRSLKRAIDDVVRRMVASGKKMHGTKQSEDLTKAEVADDVITPRDVILCAESLYQGGIALPQSSWDDTEAVLV